MQNNHNDWLDDALDEVPSASAPEDFAARLQHRLKAEGLRTESKPAGPRLVGSTAAEASASWAPRWARPLLGAAAAALLLGLGYQWGSEDSNIGQIEIDPGGELALAEVAELYEIRDVLETWELNSDAELEIGMQLLAEEQSAILDDLIEVEDKQ